MHKMGTTNGKVKIKVGRWFFHGLGEGGVFYFLRWSNIFKTVAELLIDAADANFRAASSFTKL